jgi:hypothetical protein
MPLVGTNFTPEQRTFLRAAADLVAPGLTDAQVITWVNQRAIELIAEDVKGRILADLREQHNQSVRQWEQGYTTAFPDDEEPEA